MTKKFPATPQLQYNNFMIVILICRIFATEMLNKQAI